MDFRGQVWKRVRKNDVFWSEVGSRLGEPRNTHTPTKNSQEYSPPPPPGELAEPYICSIPSLQCDFYRTCSL